MSASSKFLAILVGGLCAAAALVAGPSASAQPCPDVEVIFARGMDEPPGPGDVGTPFVDALRGKTNRVIGVYPVNYAAKKEDAGRGVDDMADHIQKAIAACPDTRLVLGGYSLGAAITNEVVNTRLAPDADQHIAAVVTFGNASRLLNVPTGVGPAFAGKTIDQCLPGDPICQPNGDFFLSHLQLAYLLSGQVNTAADFTAARL